MATDVPQNELQALQQRVVELEARLAESDQFFALSLDMLGVIDSEGVFVRLNPAWEQTLGYALEELIGHSYTEFIHPDDLDATTEAGAQVAQGASVVGFENRYRHKDGSYRWLEWRSWLAPNQPRIYTIAHDVTQRKHQEESLRMSESRLLQFLDGLPVGVFVIDPQGNPFYANQTAQEILGKGIMPVGDGGALAEVYSAYVAGSDELYPAERMPLMRALHGEVATIDDMEIQRPDGRVLLEVVGRPIYNRDGSIAYAMTAFSDITKRRAAEEALRQTMLQDEIIRMQAATLAELSTPLIPITEKVMVMPLVGSVDSGRAQQVLDTLLHGIAESGAQLAILDITGVPVVDTQVANAIVRAAQAVRLLGADVMLSGIRPEVAQTLVGLGTDLSDIITRGTLQDSISFALGRNTNGKNGHSG